MEKIWLKSYPEGVPATVDPDRYRSLAHLLDESFATFATRDAYACMGRTMTYAALDRHSRDLGAWFQRQGLPKGARIAVMMPNVLQYPVTVAAALRAGYTIVNVNPLYTPRELEHQLHDSGAEAIVVLENFATTLQQVIARTQVRHVVVASLGDLLGPVKGAVVNFVARRVKKLVPPYRLPDATPFRAALRAGAQQTFAPAALHHDDVAFLQYTGGTTGVSKGAMLTHRNVIANILQNDAWSQPALRKTPQIDALVTVCALPLYHILALNACMLMGARWGAMNLLIPNPRDIDGFVKELSRYRVNFFPGVNTLFNALLNHSGFAALDFTGLRITLGGGMAVQEVVSQRWMKTTGCPILEGYGLSETSPTVTLNPATLAAFNGTIGLPVPSTEIALLGENDVPVPQGQSGEIAIRGPQVMAGYWNRPDETEKVMTPDGFFKSGDIGVMDERGYVRIVDRKKDMILVSGFNVYPNEIESVVAAHPGVVECACVGVPDPNSGEAVKLFVVRRDPALTADELMAYCKQEFTGYKKPKYIEFRDSLPKSNIGKILRRELRDQEGQPA
ncbi:long-chain fatty acid--CoA ligase [Burkholderia stagnalis]|uniref:long-chain-fatty-acid--CoA ligase n=1 Tax=Burkholderia stagnalis TaxID=1503054 RepID=UPI00075C55D6|nr:long-chain-fatty-acid--CoA ligase [Burkholderia stagnalis]AOK52648.1 long-chain fatty acid--CoA ligase [Burkholderia stagnalis]KVN73838.1 long-chain fatty acid--CoA ligase [Burkholderia stagnalis]KWO27010.1 long-chain fatty acid--CoA ligase [Burkholderia stagnalis]KWO45007.1 long-chain fatty acid--CoA ligase [Burkholderia stagnalis]